MKVTVGFSIGHVLDHVLIPHQLVRHLNQGREAHVDFGLAGGGHFMVMGLHFDSQIVQSQDHFSADVLEDIHGRTGEIAFLMTGLVTQVGPSSRSLFQMPLDRVDLVMPKSASTRSGYRLR